MRSRSEHRELGPSLPCRVRVQNRAVGDANATSALEAMLVGPGPGNRFGSWGHGGLAAGRMGATAAVSLPQIRAAAAYSAPCCGDPGGEQPLCRASVASLGKTIPLKNPKGTSTQAHTESLCTGVHTRPARAQVCAQADHAAQMCSHGCTLWVLRMELELRGRRLCRLRCCYTQALLYRSIK